MTHVNGFSSDVLIERLFISGRVRFSYLEDNRFADGFYIPNADERYQVIQSLIIVQSLVIAAMRLSFHFSQNEFRRNVQSTTAENPLHGFAVLVGHKSSFVILYACLINNRRRKFEPNLKIRVNVEVGIEQKNKIFT